MSKNALPARLSHTSILIVDDIKFNQLTLTSALKESGYKYIEHAANGAEALEKTYQLKPDIVLLDLHMPVMDGFEYCTKIRQDSNLNFMPIIAQTASDEREDKLRAFKCGADDFVYRPFDLAELLLRISLHAQRHALLRDMEDVREYLTMELGQASEIIKQLKQAFNQEKILTALDEHCEVMKMISMSPNHQAAA